jgi:hypothetical protein
MIHAYLFVTRNNKDRDGHGPEFCKWMNEINQKAGTNITVFHTFRDEVNHYRTHVWQCNGPCRDTPPFFGICRRSMNRPPQPADHWWAEHQMKCGGTYTKISGPDQLEDGSFPGKKKRIKKQVKSMHEEGVHPSRATNESMNKKPKLLDAQEFFKPKNVSPGLMIVEERTIPGNSKDIAVVVRCPACKQFVEQDHIHAHLDDCLMKE